jgi:hypothetical protein
MSRPLGRPLRNSTAQELRHDHSHRHVIVRHHGEIYYSPLFEERRDRDALLCQYRNWPISEVTLLAPYGKDRVANRDLYECLAAGVAAFAERVIVGLDWTLVVGRNGV